MPDPITAQLIDCAWADIEKAVTSGLAMEVPYKEPRPALKPVVVVDENEKISDVKKWYVVPVPDALPHVRVEASESGDTFDIMHHYDLSYHDLHAPDTKAIEKWARKARKFELRLALRQYALRAARRSFKADDLDQAHPGGWGPRQWVVFSSADRETIPGRWPGADRECTFNVDVKPVDGIQAVVFRTAGGPYVRRPDDLSLGWTPVGPCKARLLLTEQLEFVDVQASTVIGIEMITPGTRSGRQN
jgi:hypothetical protein